MFLTPCRQGIKIAYGILKSFLLRTVALKFLGVQIIFAINNTLFSYFKKSAYCLNINTSAGISVTTYKCCNEIHFFFKLQNV